ncbi:MAG: MFS transporter [Alphaproteobacteria bacterium]|nr:MFS transporter [Alphaproteobacteria bacterium]
MSYLSFILANSRFLGFGFLVMFSSCFGQTYFVALFAPQLRTEFSLSHGDLGLYYSVGTLASSVTLLWAGRLIDRFDLRWFVGGVIAGLAAASALLASVQTAVAIPIAFCLLRLFGQGLMPHVASTAMSRYFETTRGKALSIATLGSPSSDALMPLLVVASVALVGWRETLNIGAIVLLATVLPAALLLLRGHRVRHSLFLRRSKELAVNGSGRGAAWTRAQVLRDPRFWILAPAMLSPSFVLGGFFFHQAHLAEEKGWLLSWVASTFAGYALGVVVTVFVAGPLIDRFGAVRLVPYKLPPLVLGLVLLAALDAPVIALVFMVCAGVGAGLGYTLTSATFAELYGTTHFGAIRAMVLALAAGISAGSPYLVGVLIDAGVTMATLAWASAILLTGATLAAYAAIRDHPENRNPPQTAG